MPSSESCDIPGVIGELRLTLVREGGGVQLNV